MRNMILKKWFCALLAVIMAAASFSAGQLAVSAESQQGALGSQQPAITASYTDSEGTVYDGNALAPGSYTMTLSVSDLYSLFNMEFTASYNEELLSFSSLGESLLQDMDFYAAPALGGEFSFYIASLNEDSLILPDNGADLFRIGITVNGDSPVDMQEVITVNENPNLTYIDVSYGDRIVPDNDTDPVIHNCYALAESDDFLGTVYPMTCDLSPDLTKYYTVSAYVGALAAPGDEFGTYATKGATVTIKTEDGSEISATTGDDGGFTLENVPNGTYTANITYKYGFNRSFTIIVDGADIAYDASEMIGIIACNWDGGSDITGGDASNCQALVGVGDSSELYDRGYDLDLSGDITGGDYAVCISFVGVTSSYDYAVTILN